MIARRTNGKSLALFSKFFSLLSAVILFTCTQTTQAQTQVIPTMQTAIERANTDFNEATKNLATSTTLETLKLANFNYKNAQPLTNPVFINSMQALVNQIEFTIDRNPDLQTLINRQKSRDEALKRPLAYLDESKVQKFLSLQELIHWFKQIEGYSKNDLDSLKNMMKGTPAMTLNQAISALDYYNMVFADPDQDRPEYRFEAGFLIEQKIKLQPILITILHTEHTLKTVTVPDHIKQHCKFDSVDQPWTLIQCEVDFNQLLTYNTAPGCEDITWYLIQIFGMQINGVDVDGLTRAKTIDQNLELKIQVPKSFAKKGALHLGPYFEVQDAKFTFDQNYIGINSIRSAALSGLRQISKIDTMMFSAGAAHTCAISNSALYCFGNSADNRLGGATSSSNWKVPNFSNVTHVSAGATHTCAISNGDLYCFGYDKYKQLGGATADTKWKVPNLTHVTQVSAGYYHTCAISNGDLYCFGWNVYIQLGGATADTKWKVPNLTNVTHVSAGATHTCAISNGDLYCFADSTDNQLGGATADTKWKVPNLTNVTHVSAGGLHTCAIADNNFYCWGSQRYGVLGDGVTADTSRADPYHLEWLE